MVDLQVCQSSSKTTAKRIALTSVLAVSALSVLFFTSSVFAARPSSELQAYAFKDLKLVKIAYMGKQMAACVATPDGKFLWVGKSYQVAGEFGKIADVKPRYVLVEQGVEVNGGEFALSQLKWPIARELGNLVEKCGKPPGN